MPGFISEFLHEGGGAMHLVKVEQCTAHTDGYTRLCERYREFESRISPRYPSRPVVKRSC